MTKPHALESAWGFIFWGLHTGGFTQIYGQALLVQPQRVVTTINSLTMRRNLLRPTRAVAHWVYACKAP